MPKPRPRLQTLKPRLQTIRPRLQTLPTYQPDATPRQRGSTWMKRRAAWLAKHPLCAHCEQRGDTTAGQIVDHIIPLWAEGPDDESNFQTLCRMDSDAKTAREAGQRARGERPTREQGLTAQ